MLADASAEFGDLNMFGMDGVSVERAPVCEDGDKTRIVRARQKQHVETDGEALHFRNNILQPAQQIHMLLARKLLDVLTILPDHDVCQHIYPSPRRVFRSLIRSPIASSAKSTFLARQTTCGGFSFSGEPLTITNSSP